MMLPRELRDYIYEAVFTNHQADVAFTSHEVRNDGIRLACKQTRAETPELYFRFTTFYCSTMEELSVFLRDGPRSSYRPQLSEIKLGWAVARVDNYPQAIYGVERALKNIQLIFRDLRKTTWYLDDVPPKVLRGCIFTHGGDSYEPCEPYRLWVRETTWPDPELRARQFRSVDELMAIEMLS